MADTVRDLSDWWPFLPASDMTLHEVCAAIYDVQVIIPVPAAINAKSYRGDAFEVVLAALDIGATNIATFKITVADMPVYEIQVPVYTGRDYRPSAGTSYVIAADVDLDFDATMYTAKLMLHPDCLMFVQEASTAVFYNRGPVNSSDEPTGAPYIVTMPRLRFDDGNNVSVSYVNDIVILNAHEGYGSGIYLVPPYIDVTTYTKLPGKGLRSITGRTGAVAITGSPNVDVLAERGAEDIDPDITLTIQRK